MHRAPRIVVETLADDRICAIVEGHEDHPIVGSSRREVVEQLARVVPQWQKEKESPLDHAIGLLGMGFFAWMFWLCFTSAPDNSKPHHHEPEHEMAPEVVEGLLNAGSPEELAAAMEGWRTLENHSRSFGEGSLRQWADHEFEARHSFERVP